MARYIDADKLFTWLDVKNRSKYPIGDAKQYNMLLIYEVLDEIDDAETEDVAPVIHAHWRDNLACDTYQTNLECSYCQHDFDIDNDCLDLFMYCPHCGAKMDEVHDG